MNYEFKRDPPNCFEPSLEFLQTLGIIIHGFPQILVRIIWQKSVVDTAEKSALTLVNWLSFKMKDLPSQRRGVLQGWVHKLASPPTIQTSVKFRLFAELYCRSCQQIFLKPGKFTSFKAFFLSAVSTDFRQLIHVKS